MLQVILNSISVQFIPQILVFSIRIAIREKDEFGSHKKPLIG